MNRERGIHFWQGDAPGIAAVKEYTVDQITPIAAFLRLRAHGARALLESVEGDRKIARYSFIGLGAKAVLFHRDGQAVLEGPGISLTSDDPLQLLRQGNEMFGVSVPDTVELPYVGGAIGYFGYDWVRRLERLPAVHAHAGVDWEWFWPESVVAFDHHRHSLTIIAEAVNGREQEAKARLITIEEALAGPITWEAPKVVRVEDVAANIDREDYYAMIERARDYIYAGDIFQVVLSQKLTTRIHGDPFDLYRKLRLVNPSPYLIYFEGSAKTLVGASPEALVRVQGKTVINRPIAGTRRRGQDAVEDEALWQELIHDPKERSEHTMLVDLARNDLGRVSEYGSIDVAELMVRESYSHVMHIASEVTGRLKASCDALDALAASFPAGTLSGAPKVRAMEIIEELEPEARGAYGGVVGYWSHRGDLDTCIAIRTLEISPEGLVTIQAGGGIVADSDPEAERRESFNKAAAPLSVLEPKEEAWL
jgi:anthranilate synthase component 1